VLALFLDVDILLRWLLGMRNHLTRWRHDSPQIFLLLGTWLESDIQVLHVRGCLIIDVDVQDQGGTTFDGGTFRKQLCDTQFRGIDEEFLLADRVHNPI
jgi:hypothetical protein